MKQLYLIGIFSVKNLIFLPVNGEFLGYHISLLFFYKVENLLVFRFIALKIANLHLSFLYYILSLTFEVSYLL